ncbi:MAG: GAF domain-containing protein [Gammaproteobacteria bacterium]
MTAPGVMQQIHEAVDRKDLFDALDSVFPEFGLALRFAIYFKDANNFEVAENHHLGSKEVLEYVLILEREWPQHSGRSFFYLPDDKLFCAKLVFRGIEFGVMLIPVEHNPIGSRPDSDFEDLFRAIAIALVNLQLRETCGPDDQVALEKIMAIKRIPGFLKNRDRDRFLANLLQTTLEIADADVGAIVLRHADGSLYCHTELGLPEDLLLSLRNVRGRGFLETVLGASELIVIGDAAKDSRIDVSGLPVRLRSLIVLPLSTEGDSPGAIVIVNNTIDPRQHDPEVFTALANLASLAITGAEPQITEFEAE